MNDRELQALAYKVQRLGIIHGFTRSGSRAASKWTLTLPMEKPSNTYPHRFFRTDEAFALFLEKLVLEDRINTLEKGLMILWRHVMEE